MKIHVCMATGSLILCRVYAVGSETGDAIVSCTVSLYRYAYTYVRVMAVLPLHLHHMGVLCYLLYAKMCRKIIGLACKQLRLNMVETMKVVQLFMQSMCLILIMGSEEDSEEEGEEEEDELSLIHI